MSLSWWRSLVNREKLKGKSPSWRRLGRQRRESRRALFEPLESRVLLASNPYINLSNGVTNSFTAGQGTWVQIPVRVDNLQDGAGDLGLNYATVQLSFSTSARITPATNFGATESGNTVTITTQAANNFVVGESVSISGSVDGRYNGTFHIAAVNGNSFSYYDPTYANLPVSGSGTATASYFDQGPVQNSVNFSVNNPIVVAGSLVPSTPEWNFATGQGNGTIKIVANVSEVGYDITAVDPTNGGSTPNGDILAYVFLHVASGLSPTSNIPVSVVDANTSLVEDTDSFNQTNNSMYPTLDPDQNATVRIVPDGTPPVAQLSVKTSGIGTATGGGSYSVPVMLTPVTPGGPGIIWADADILFDPNYINPSSINVTAGNLLSNLWTAKIGVSTGGGYNQDGTPPSVDTGAMNLSAVGSTRSLSNLAATSTGSLWVIHFTTMPGVTGSTVLNLVPDTYPVGAATNLGDNSLSYSFYSLSAAPTERLDDSVDGTIQFSSGVSTTTTVTASSSSVVYGTPVTFTAAVTSQGGGAPTGSVEFYDYNLPLQNQDLGPGALISSSSTSSTSTWTLATGARTLSVTAGDAITAVYTPGTGFAGSSGAKTGEVVTAAPLTVTGITASNKTYNGNATATLQGLAAANLLGVISGDAVTLGTSAALGTFTTKDVKQNITVSVSGLTLSGAQAGDYTLTQPTTTANITPAPLTVSGITAADKVYNANLTATLNTSGATLVGAFSGDTVTLSTSGATGTYASKDVAQNVVVSVAGLTVSGAAVTAGDYTLAQPTTTANITPAPLTVSGITAASKVYNANLVAVLNTSGATLVGAYNGDTVTLSTSGATGTFASKDVAQNVTVSVAGLTVSGAAVTAGDYTLMQPTTTANITPATLTVAGVTAANKIYNANTVAILDTSNASLSGLFGGDAVTLSTSGATGTFATKDVGSNIAVSVSGLTIGGAQAGDYSLTQPSPKANITKLMLTVSGVTAADKVYNANAGAVLSTSNASLVGVYGGDAVTLNTGSAIGLFINKDVAQNVQVSVSGLTISGPQVGDYSLAQPAMTANITPATLTVLGIAAVDKVYNANTTAVLNTSNASLSGLFGGDAVTLSTSGASGTFASKDVAQNVAVSVSGLTIGGAQAGDYTLTQPSPTANITPAALTVSGVTAANKVYNANLAAVVNASGAALVGVYSGDTVTLSTGAAAGAFATKNVAQNIAVSVSGLTIGGAQAGDYTLTQPGTTANITPAGLTVSGVTAANKVYNANLVATVSTTGATLAGVFSGDTVTLGAGGATGTFASKDVAQNVAVSVSGLTIGGAQAGDYTLTQPSTTANITPATLTVSGVTAANKVYNANLTAVLNTAGAALVGVYGGDTVTLSTNGATGAFASKDVAQNIAVSVSGLTSGGAQAGDYTLTQPSTTANITPAGLTVSGVTAANKVYNANLAAVLNTAGAALVGVYSGDTVTLGTSGAAGAFASKDVAQNVAVSVSGLTIGGAQAGDYALTQPSTTANITPATLTVSGVTAANKVYNANLVATLNTTSAALVGVYSGDTVTLGTSGAAGVFASKDVAQNIAVSVSGLTLGGAQAGDYTLTQPSSAANITPATLTVSGVTAANKVYNANLVAVVNASGAALVGVYSGDTVTLSTSGAAGAFATKDVAQNIAVSVSGLTIGGAQAADYALAEPTATANITPAPLTVTATGVNKGYDETTAATVILSDNRLDGDRFTDTYQSASFSDPSVGNDKTVTVSGIAISGPDAGDYSLQNTTAITTADILPGVGTSTVVTTSGSSVAYGTSVTFTAAITAALGTIPPGQGSVDFVDTTTGADLGAGTFAGSSGVTSTWTLATGAKTLNATAGDTITATYAPGGGFAGSSGTTTQVVTAIPVTVTGITAADKTYNGNTAATLHGLATASLTGVLPGDAATLDVSGALGTFASKDAAQSITVSVSGLTLAGAQAEDYTLTQPTTTANITPAALTVSGVTAADKVYNANRIASLNTSGAALVGVYSGDAVTLSTSGAAGAFASKDAAQNVTVSVSGLTLGGGQAGDYTLTQPTATANITPATLTASGVTAADKVYNANLVAIVNTSGATLAGVYSGDTVTLTTSGAAGTFASKDVAQHIAVSVSGLTLGGAQAGDYMLTQPTTVANITPAGLTVSGITAVDKVYDANLAAALNTSGAALVGVYSGDTVTLNASGAAGTLASKNVARNITVSISGLTLGGAQAGDYTLTQPTATANISARPITVTALANVKTYDGTAGASAVPTITGGSLASGDTATFNEVYNTKNVGVGEVLTPVATINDGNSGNNYAVALVTSSQGAIGQRAITVTAAANSKVYDGTTSAAALPAITGGSLASGDSATWSETYDTPAPGTGKTLTPTGVVSDGDGGADYNVAFVNSTAGVISQAVDHFLVTLTPSSIAAGNNFLIIVTAEDVNNQIVTSYAGTVGFASADPLEPVPAGNLTFTQGVGMAATLGTLETAGNWTVTATDTANPSLRGVSNTITVTPASASTVAFGVQPGSTQAGANIPVTVDVDDAYGNLVPYNGNVTLATASGKLLGSTTMQAAGGVATFGNLSVDQAGSYSLSASAAGVGGTATSNSFDVTPGAAAKLAFAMPPANTGGTNPIASLTVAVEDQYGNTVTTDHSAVTLTLNPATSGGGGVLKGTTTETASGGLAAFSGLSIVDPSNPNWSAAGTGYTLTANDNGITGKSAPFNTTFVVTSCIMTPTGFVATFSQPFKVATTPVVIGPNLYSAAATLNLPANVALIGSNEGTVRGSLVLNSTDTQVTFVATTMVGSTGSKTERPLAGVSSPDATSGILAPDGYTVVLDSTSTSFVTTNGQLLDGADKGTGGNNFIRPMAVNNSADVDVVIPSFARGPSSPTVTSTVNVPNDSTPIFASSPMTIATSANNGAMESGNTVTITTSSVHGLVTGQTVTIAGFTGAYAGYNGTFTVASVPSTTTFTYTDSTSGLVKSGGGTATGYGLTESGNTVTAWTTVPSGLTVGEPVTISVAGVAGYNGTFTITSLPGGSNSTTFTYTDANAGLANSGGGTAALASGIPISLIGPTSGVTSGQFTLTYNASDLSISGALVDPSLAASYGATLSLDAASTPGNAIIDFSTTTPLPSASGTPILLGGLTATVPSAAYYKATDLLHFSSVSLAAGGSSVPAIGTDALHLVAFLGDGSGDGSITSADMLDMSRVIAGADAGFAAYPLADPLIIGDILSDTQLGGSAGSALGRYINGITTPQMPIYPGAPTNMLGAGLIAGSPVTPQPGSAGSVAAPAAVVDTALPASAGATTSVVAAPAVSASAAVAVKATALVSAVGVSAQGTASAGAARASRQAADDLFAALGRGADAAGLAIPADSGGEQSAGEALATQMSAAASAQANLDSLFWESADSSWLDGKCDWLS